jgi:hypothetical protein
MYENNEFYAVFCTMRLDFNDLFTLTLIKIDLLYFIQNAAKRVPLDTASVSQIHVA